MPIENGDIFPNPHLYDDIARGVVPDKGVIHKFGMNPNINTGDPPVDIWDAGGLWVPPTTTRLHNISSTNAADAVGGTGATHITIEGLGSDWTTQSEVVPLNGTTSVSTVLAYLRVFRMYLSGSGSSNTNAGAITATAAIDLTVSAHIAVNLGQSLMAIYTVPAGKRALVKSMYSTIIKSSGGSTASAAIYAMARPNAHITTSSWRVQNVFGVSFSGSSLVEVKFKPPHHMPAYTDMIIRCQSVSASGTEISGGFTMIVEDA